MPMSETPSVYGATGKEGTERAKALTTYVRGSFFIQAIEDAFFATRFPSDYWEVFRKALIEKQAYYDPSTANGLEHDGLPRAPMTPIRDMVLAQRVKQEKIGAVWLPDDAIQSQICRVLAVGPGLMLDDGVMRPAPCKRGDVIFTTPNDGYRVVLNGEELWVFEAMEVIAVLIDEDATGYGNETCLNE